jgi:hypothetical protein
MFVSLSGARAGVSELKNKITAANPAVLRVEAMDCP